MNKISHCLKTMLIVLALIMPVVMTQPVFANDEEKPEVVETEEETTEEDAVVEEKPAEEKPSEEKPEEKPTTEEGESETAPDKEPAEDTRGDEITDKGEEGEETGEVSEDLKRDGEEELTDDMIKVTITSAEGENLDYTLLWISGGLLVCAGGLYCFKVNKAKKSKEDKATK
jgi:cytoskeletal protein RodZ